MPGNGAVTRSTLRQQLADALRDEVLAGRLQPGQEFTVKEIAEQYGVSATPVREALVDLSAQGLLEADQHRGFRVHEFSPADYRGMIEARILIIDGIFRNLTGRESEAAAEPAAGASGVAGYPVVSFTPRVEYQEGPRLAAALAAVRRRGAEAQRAAEAGELGILIGYDIRFWRELSVCYGNPYLADFLHRLRVQCWVCVVQHLRDVPDLRGRLWAGHTELVDALARRDATEALKVIGDYNAHSLSLIER